MVNLSLQSGRFPSFLIFSIALQGVEKQVIKAGSGQLPQKGQTIEVHCTGSLSTGAKFWSTKDPGQQPFSFQVGLGKVCPFC
jgi:FKBP-type peptidyl-prolyl cis-trans isomerase